MTQEETSLFGSLPPAELNTPSYRVLARQYRPRRFEEVIGQETIIHVLTQALLQERLGHGFLFSGIRGVGKTTIARLLACTLNCLDLQKITSQHVEACGKCASCEAFAAEKHLDILEMDAASHTGVDDIREILEACRYRPVLGQYKVFIIDEVHMLSKNAFNALLKTLEEPPPHVKFIFATTESRKIPATILSRCLRFDLKRLDVDILVPHLEKICAQEHIEAEKEALFLIARAGSGSARDSLSLLDQAIVLAQRHEGRAGLPCITGADVRNMLGLLDREQISGLIEAIFEGDAAASLQHARSLYTQGLEPLMILEELSTVIHHVSCLKVGVDEMLKGLGASEKNFLKKWEKQLALPTLGRLWQMLLKGEEEMRQATFPHSVLEMLLIRLAYVTPLPTPDQLLKGEKGSPSVVSAPERKIQVKVSASADKASPSPTFVSFQDVLKAVERKREGLLHTHLMQDVILKSFDVGHITLFLRGAAPSDICKRLEHFLKQETGSLWKVVGTTSSPAEGKTLREESQAKQRALHQAVEAHPLIEQAHQLFPGMVIKEVRQV